MPYKGYIKSEEYKQRQKEYRQTDTYYKYTHQRSLAKDRGIEWKFTFEDWCEVWQDSGYWAERGQYGYVMCRKGDTGPYSIDNVYIGTQQENHAEAINNRNMNFKLTKAEVEEIKKELETNYWGLATKLAKEYNVARTTIYDIKSGKSHSVNSGCS